MLATATTGKSEPPVRLIRITLVLIGVLVTPTFTAAINPMIAIENGINCPVASDSAVPAAAPIKKSGKIKPPRNPLCRVNPIESIFTRANSKSKPTAPQSV